MPQSTVTIVTEVERADDLENALATVRPSLDLAFAQIEAVHFARLLLVPGLPELGLAPQLLMAVVFDGTARACTEKLVALARNDLDTLYAHCPEYARRAQPLVDFLLGHDVPPGLFYHGAEDVNVATIKAMTAVRDTLRARLDVRLQHGGSTESAFSLANEACEEYEAVPEARNIVLPPPDGRSPLELKIRTFGWIGNLTLVALALAAVPAAIGYALGLGAWSLLLGAAALLLPLAELLRRELTLAAQQQNQIVLPEPEHLRQVLDEEDLATQNALTHCSLVEGTFRRVVLWIVFKAIGWRVSMVDSLAGSLGGITSIHFGRWVLIDKGKKTRRLIFMADYDGSWESYLGEFVDRAAAGLSAVWGNTRDFPATLLLIGRGAHDEQRFKSWTRANQLSTPIWYSAYPDQTLRNIENNLRIARGAPFRPAPPEQPAWLASL